jgi:hypothetical protein
MMVVKFKVVGRIREFVKQFCGVVRCCGGRVLGKRRRLLRER